MDPLTCRPFISFGKGQHPPLSKDQLVHIDRMMELTDNPFKLIAHYNRLSRKEALKRKGWIG